MDRQKYKNVYSSLYDFKDVFRLSEEFEEPAGMLATILNQKVVKMTKFKHRKIYSREQELFLIWKQGLSILELAEFNDFPPTLMASLIMKNCALPRKNINWLFKNIDSIKNHRLRKEVKKALEADYFFSLALTRCNVKRVKWEKQSSENGWMTGELSISLKKKFVLREMARHQTLSYQVRYA